MLITVFHPDVRLPVLSRKRAWNTFISCINYLFLQRRIVLENVCNRNTSSVVINLSLPSRFACDYFHVNLLFSGINENVTI